VYNTWKTTDIIETIHPLESTRSFSTCDFHPYIFTHAFSPTGFHPPFFTHLFPPTKWVKRNSYTISKIKMQFHPSWVKMAFSTIFAAENENFTHQVGENSEDVVADMITRFVYTAASIFWTGD